MSLSGLLNICVKWAAPKPDGFHCAPLSLPVIYFLLAW